jgi:hypothetical protein
VKSKSHFLSVINRSLSTSGILSRSTKGGRNGFSSPSDCLEFGAINATIPTRKNNVSRVVVGGGTDCNGGENKINLFGAMSG